MDTVTKSLRGRAGLLDFKRFFKKLEERVEGIDFTFGDLVEITKHPDRNPLIYQNGASRRMEGLAHADLYRTNSAFGDFVRSCGLVLITGETKDVGEVLVEWGTILDPSEGDRRGKYTTARVLLPRIRTPQGNTPRCSIKIWAQELGSCIVYERRDHRKLIGASLRRDFGDEYPSDWFFEESCNHTSRAYTFDEYYKHLTGIELSQI